MSSLIMAAQLILGLSILVTLHELGHFMAARAFGIRVEKFYLFFDAWNVKLFSVKIGDTEYGMGWLPFGGYVKIAGMVDESLDREALKQEPQPWEFRSKPAWQRLIVMIGGVTMNVILAIVIYWSLIYKYGESYLPLSQVKHGIVAHELGKGIGLQTGDQIIAINNHSFENFDDLYSSKVLFGAALTVVRNNETLAVKVPLDFVERISPKNKDRFIEPRKTFFVGMLDPKSNADRGGLLKGDVIRSVNNDTIKYFDQLQDALQKNAGKTAKVGVLRGNKNVMLTIEVDKTGRIGFFPESKDFTFKTTRYGFFQSLPVGIREAEGVLSDNIKGFGKIVRGEVSAKNSLQGPIGIAKIYGGQWDWIKFWSMTALLSVVLAFMNILPIPALDGGHVVFLTLEAVTRRKFSDSFMEKAQIVGMVILLSLMAFALGNDIWKNIIN